MNMRVAFVRVGIVLCCFQVVVLAAPAKPKELWRCDFEGLTSVDAIEGIRWGKMNARLVERAPGKGSCLEISTKSPTTFCSLDIVVPVTIESNLILSFDHREEIDPGKTGAYMGMSFFSGGKQGFWHSDTFSGEWRHVEVSLPQLDGRFGIDMKAGLVLDRIQLYGRSKDEKKRGDNPCNIKVWFDNIRLYVGELSHTSVSGKVYTCHNNPPLMDWRGPTTPGTGLQYSMDPMFQADTTQSVALTSARPYYTPPAPLTPGTWYFRRRTTSELYDGWTPSQELKIPEQTHNYAVPSFDSGALSERPRPRLLGRIRPDGKSLTDAERASRVKQARTGLKPGIPEHPGPYKKDDPRWPHWIDWYGEVAGKVTARTGSRIRRVAEAAILTGDSEAIAAAKSLLVEVCKWDPDGGSSARRGDLQAASLLKGMVWAYDACEATLTEEERLLVHDILKRRILQFYTRINPFRINPAQNHPWKKTAIVAESALVMMGVFPEAEEWLDVAVQCFALRILPSMGFQGENQEGISYWSYGVNMLANFADLMRFMAGVDLYDHPWLRQTCRFPMYCAPPDAYAISFADNSYRGNVSIKGVYGTKLIGLLGERVGDPYALWYANRPSPGIDTKPPADIPQSAYYPYIGQVFFNTCLSDGLESVSVGMRSGAYYAGHQHDDNNGFVIHAYGDKLAIDGGYYDWYGSPHFKAYSIKTLAHNTLLVNDQCQKRGTDGRIVAHFESPGFGYAVGDAATNPKVYEGQLKRFDRRLLFLKPAFVIVHDLVEAADGPAKLDWLLHAHTDEAFPADPAQRTFTIEREKARLHGRFLAPSDVTLTVTKSFDIAPQKPRQSVFLPWDEVQPEWTLTATPAAKRLKEEFLVVMEVQRADDAAAPARVRHIETSNAYGCELEAPYGTYTVLLRKQEGTGTLSAGGIETDGEVAAVLVGPDGVVLNSLAIAATSVRFNGKQLFRSDTPRSWSMDEGHPPAWLQAKLETDASDLQMDGCRHALPDGDISTWWATLETEERGRSKLVVHGWTGARPPHIRVNGRTHAETSMLVALPKGKTCLAVTGRGSFDKISMKPKRYAILQVAQLPASTVVHEGDIVIDSDAPGPVAQSHRKGKVMDKVASTGGKAFCCIDGPVQWAEWEFETPAGGTYELLVRGASEHDLIEREITIDGRAFPGEGTAIRMKGTSGWCRETDDWAWSRVVGPKGQPVKVHLATGKHTLRWEFVTGSQNVDVFIFRPVAE